MSIFGMLRKAGIEAAGDEVEIQKAMKLIDGIIGEDGASKLRLDAFSQELEDGESITIEGSFPQMVMAIESSDAFGFFGVDSSNAIFSIGSSNAFSLDDQDGKLNAFVSDGIKLKNNLGSTKTVSAIQVGIKS